MVFLKGSMTCGTCDNDDALLSHPTEAMFDLETDDSADLSTWWQSVTWYYLGRTPQVNITLSLEQTYQTESIGFVFKNSRPHRMVLEKSVDNGVAWSPLQYYSSSCRCDALMTPDKMSPSERKLSTKTPRRRNIQL